VITSHTAYPTTTCTRALQSSDGNESGCCVIIAWPRTGLVTGITETGEG
jgi:hypothetical protein